MTQYENQVPASHPVLNALGTFFKVLLRLLAVLVFGALIGVGLYYGIPWAYRTLIRPVQENRARIVALEHQTRQSQERVQEEAEVLQERLATLETKIGALEERAGVQEANLASHEEELQQQAAALAQLPEDIGALELELSMLEEDLAFEATAAMELQADFERSLEDLAARAADRGVDFEDEPALAALGRKLVVDFAFKDGVNRTLLDGKDVSRKIRDPAVAAGASRVAKLPEVRAALLDLQRRLGARGGAVAEGRDIGTIVFPDAELKFFLTATEEERRS